MTSFVGVAALALGVCAGDAWARDATVRKKDGTALTGELVTQNDKVVVLRIASIETPIPRENIAEVELLPTAQEVYDEVRPTLDEGDLEARLDLAQRVYRMGDLELARRELGDLSRSFPGEPRIGRLDRQIEADQELARQKAQPRQTDTGSEAARSADGSGNPLEQPAEGELLTAEQVNVIRVYEIDLSEEPRGIRIDRETMGKFFEVYRGDDGQPLDRRGRAAFMRRPPHEQLEAFFEAQVRDLYGKVEVLNDPPALATYRTQINPQYVVRYFRQHFGQGQVSGLKLHANRPNAVEEAYTNFHNLHRFVGPDSTPMIDRVAPEDSLLLQWGLPRDVAKSPAPQVEGWQPAFRSVDDPQYRRIVDWIATLYSPAPDYGIQAPGAAAEGEAGEGQPTPPAEAPPPGG